MKKLSSYLSAGIAATATFQSSDAATIVTLYGLGAQSPSTTPATPAGLLIGYAYTFMNNYRALDKLVSNKSYFALTISDNYFTSGTDLKASGNGLIAKYLNNGSFRYGAQSGSTNYANISFNGNDGVYEAVGQFNLNGLGGGYLVALAINNDNTALSISAGKTAIDAVPEPSAIALLSLGAGGLMLRRRRKAA